MKQITVPKPIKAGGPILNVCRDCEKYGKKLSFVEVDRIMRHCKGIDVVFIGEEGE